MGHHAPVFSSLRQILRAFRLPVCGLALLFMTVEAIGATRAETLEAIHRIENPFNSPRPGKYGELGAYQFRKGTWYMHTKIPFERAIERRVSEEVAILH